MRLAGDLEPKADSPPGLNVYKYLNIKACQHNFIPLPLIHTLSSYGDHTGKSLPLPSSASSYLTSSSALLVGRRPLRPLDLCSPLLPGHRHPQSSFLLVVQRSVSPSQPDSWLITLIVRTVSFTGALISYVIVCQSVFPLACLFAYSPLF